MVRLICLSDIHGQQSNFKIPAGDILILAGDFCSLGTEREVHKAAKWLRALPHPAKIVVAGNHDRFFEQQPSRARAYLEYPGVHYLEDTGCEIEGIRFWGSPWQPCFMDWAFNLPRKGPELRDRCSRIPIGTDVLITHCPPHGILDKVQVQVSPWGETPEPKMGSLGCEELALRVSILKPQLHVFGHIHDGYGLMERDGTMFINASICNEDYDPANAVWVVDLEPGLPPMVSSTLPGKKRTNKCSRQQTKKTQR